MLKYFRAMGCVFLGPGLFLGCDTGERVFGLQGVVKHADQPVPEGTVTFEEINTKITGQASLDQGGRYALRLSPGNYKVFVEPPMVQETGVSDAALTYKNVKNIPAKYRSAQTTPLSVNVEKQATVDFDLKK